MLLSGRRRGYIGFGCAASAHKLYAAVAIVISLLTASSVPSAMWSCDWLGCEARMQ